MIKPFRNMCGDKTYLLNMNFKLLKIKLSKILVKNRTARGRDGTVNPHLVNLGNSIKVITVMKEINYK